DRRPGAERDRAARRDAEHGAVPRGDGVAADPGLVEHLEPHVDGGPPLVGAHDVGPELVVLHDRREQGDELGGLAVREGRERGIGDPGAAACGEARHQAGRDGQAERAAEGHRDPPLGTQAQGMRTSGMFTTVGGGRLQGAAGLQIVCTLSTSNAVQKTFGDVATTRAEPFRRLGSPFPAVLKTMIASSCMTAVPAVEIVTVCPGGRASFAPLPGTQHPGQTAPGHPLTVSVLLSTVHACATRLPTLHTVPAAPTLFRSAPVSSKASRPMSTATVSMLVHA